MRAPNYWHLPNETGPCSLGHATHVQEKEEGAWRRGAHAYHDKKSDRLFEVVEVNREETEGVRFIVTE